MNNYVLVFPIITGSHSFPFIPIRKQTVSLLLLLLLLLLPGSFKRFPLKQNCRSVIPVLLLKCEYLQFFIIFTYREIKIVNMFWSAIWTEQVKLITLHLGNSDSHLFLKSAINPENSLWINQQPNAPLQPAIDFHSVLYGIKQLYRLSWDSISLNTY